MTKKKRIIVTLSVKSEDILSDISLFMSKSQVVNILIEKYARKEFGIFTAPVSVDK